MNHHYTMIQLSDSFCRGFTIAGIICFCAIGFAAIGTLIYSRVWHWKSHRNRTWRDL
jgi:hypothetical protein